MDNNYLNPSFIAQTIIMKQIFLLILIIGFASLGSVKAQSGFSTNTYYQYQYQISDVALGYPYPKYNYYNQYIGTYQLFQRAVWHRETGGENVSVWNGWQWVSEWVNGSYWWFEWVNYEKYVSY